MFVRIYRILSDARGQDLVEYALVAGFIAIGVAATLPSVAVGISTIFSQLISVLPSDGATGFGS
jgi:Flp pilus assembly pilin Flp